MRPRFLDRASVESFVSELKPAIATLDVEWLSELRWTLRSDPTLLSVDRYAHSELFRHARAMAGLSVGPVEIPEAEILKGGRKRESARVRESSEAVGFPRRAADAGNEATVEDSDVDHSRRIPREFPRVPARVRDPPRDHRGDWLESFE